MALQYTPAFVSTSLKHYHTSPLENITIARIFLLVCDGQTELSSSTKYYDHDERLKLGGRAARVPS